MFKMQPDVPHFKVQFSQKKLHALRNIVEVFYEHEVQRKAHKKSELEAC